MNLSNDRVYVHPDYTIRITNYYWSALFVGDVKSLFDRHW